MATKTMAVVKESSLKPQKKKKKKSADEGLYRTARKPEHRPLGKPSMTK